MFSIDIAASPLFCKKRAYLCDPNPFFNDSGSFCGCGGRGRRRGMKQRSDDPVGDCIELGDGGPNSGWEVLIFVSLGPHTAQTLERDYFHEQVLQHQEHQHYKMTVTMTIRKQAMKHRHSRYPYGWDVLQHLWWRNPWNLQGYLTQRLSPPCSRLVLYNQLDNLPQYLDVQKTEELKL